MDYKPQGLQSKFRIKRRTDGEILDFTLNLPGRHNVSNATAALAVALEEGVKILAISNAFENFAGIDRRFQVHPGIRCAQGSVTLIDDYGHHPNEFKSHHPNIPRCFPELNVLY